MTAPATPRAAKLSARAARALAGAAVRSHFGRAPRRINVLAGGLSNAVFEAEVSARLSVVVRLHGDPGKQAAYRREGHAMARAGEAGIPVPEVLHVGTVRGRPFMLSTRLRGIPGTHATDRLAVLQQLGAHAARLHSLVLPGYGPGAVGADRQDAGVPAGSAGEAGTPTRYARWRDYVDAELDVRGRIELLLAHRALPPATVPTLRHLLDHVRSSRGPGVLQHGDLRLKNVIVDPESGRIVGLIDWEQCLSAPPPAWDLAIALHDLGPDGKQALLRGYGLSPPNTRG